MEFQDVVRRRMVRSYQPGRPVPPDVVDRIVRNGLRAPSAGFSQGWGFLVLDNPADIGRFRDAVRPEAHPEDWFAARVDAPLLIIPHSNKDAYLDRYARPDKGFTDRSEAWWPAPYWDIDTGFASLLMLLTAVDAGLGACFFGMPADRIGAFRAAFGVPSEYSPIGVISVGYSSEPPRDLSSRRRPAADIVHRGRWNHPARQPAVPGAGTGP
ncbi:MAG TPA: nitroreductase family protein [Streptosporangiaceae bacterium]|nr:nitroreductase family protein [Streptosporangiaceae bacterium]